MRDELVVVGDTHSIRYNTYSNWHATADSTLKNKMVVSNTFYSTNNCKEMAHWIKHEMLK